MTPGRGSGSNTANGTQFISIRETLRTKAPVLGANMINTSLKIRKCLFFDYISFKETKRVNKSVFRPLEVLEFKKNQHFAVVFVKKFIKTPQKFQIRSFLLQIYL